MHAYDEMYLDDAMDNLGEALDYAENACNLPMDEFMELFIASGKADEFGAGVPRIVSGRSGTELVMDILEEFWDDFKAPPPLEGSDCSPEYWCGWILACYQWRTGRPFKSILEKLSMREILALYPYCTKRRKKNFLTRRTVSSVREQYQPNCSNCGVLPVTPSEFLRRRQKLIYGHCSSTKQEQKISIRLRFPQCFH